MKLKKAMVFLMVCCMIFGFSMTAQANVTVTGNHHWESEWHIQKEPTCTEPGIEIRHCTTCTLTDTRTIPALGHDLTTRIEKEPTCTTAGLEVTTCSRCNYRRETPIKSLGHHMVTKKTTPTVKNDGKEETYCDRCHTVFKTVVLPRIDLKEKVMSQRSLSEDKAEKKKRTEEKQNQTKASVPKAIPQQQNTAVQSNQTSQKKVEVALQKNTKVATDKNEVATAGETPVAASISNSDDGKNKPVTSAVQKTEQQGLLLFARNHAADGVLMMMAIALMAAGASVAVPYRRMCVWEKTERKKALDKLRGRKFR